MQWADRLSRWAPRARAVFHSAGFALLIAACSGGGGSGDALPIFPPPAPPALEAFVIGAGRPIAGPGAITAAHDGTLFVLGFDQLESGGFQNALFRVTTAGVSARLAVSLSRPRAVATDRAGNVYLGDNVFCGGRFCSIPPANVQRIAPDGTVTPYVITGSSDQSSASLHSVSGLAVEASGDVRVSDEGWNAIFRLTPEGDLTTIAGAADGQGSVSDGVGRNARFAGPAGIAMDDAGNLYVADSRGHTIRRVTSDGVVTTLAGIPSVAGSADSSGPGEVATFDSPQQVAVDASRNVYVADFGNALIRKISPTGVVTTVAGTRGRRGFTPGPGPGVIDPPRGLALVGRNLFFTMEHGIGVLRNVP